MMQNFGDGKELELIELYREQMKVGHPDELRYAIVSEDDQIIIKFSRPTDWWKLSVTAATELRDAITSQLAIANTQD